MTIPVVLVTFQDRHWSYLNHIEDLKPGDQVVIPYGTDRFVVGKVAGLPISDDQAARATKWIVSKVEGMEKWETLTALRPPPEPVKPDPNQQLKALIKTYASAMKQGVSNEETIKFRRPGVSLD